MEQNTFISNGQGGIGLHALYSQKQTNKHQVADPKKADNPLRQNCRVVSIKHSKVAFAPVVSISAPHEP
jgi:hypothetical protein